MSCGLEAGWPACKEGASLAPPNRKTALLTCYMFRRKASVQREDYEWRFPILGAAAFEDCDRCH